MPRASSRTTSTSGCRSRRSSTRGPDPGTFHAAGSPGPVSKHYRVGLFPTFYVIDPHGKVAWAATGEQPDALLLQNSRAASRAG